MYLGAVPFGWQVNVEALKYKVGLLQEKKFKYDLPNLLPSTWLCTCDLRWIWQLILCVILGEVKLREKSFELTGLSISQSLHRWRRMDSKAFVFYLAFKFELL